MKELINFIKHYQQLDSETERAILENFKLEIVEKNEFILEKGKVSSKIYFIKSGLVRRYYFDEEYESTIWIYNDNHWIASLASYFLQQPSLEYLQACEKTILYSLSFEREQILLQLPQFINFHIKFLRSSIAAFDEFHFIFASMTASKKYEYLLKKFPLIIQKAKQKDIASLLNVSQETLSRIRASIN